MDIEKYWFSDLKSTGMWRKNFKLPNFYWKYRKHFWWKLEWECCKGLSMYVKIKVFLKCFYLIKFIYCSYFSARLRIVWKLRTLHIHEWFYREHTSTSSCTTEFVHNFVPYLCWQQSIIQLKFPNVYLQDIVLSDLWYFDLSKAWTEKLSLAISLENIWPI